MSSIVTKVVELLFTSKYGALACLVLQNTFLVVYMNISRTAKGNMYASSTAVVSMECLKIVSSVCVMWWEKKSVRLVLDSIYQETWVNPKEAFYVPSGIPIENTDYRIILTIGVAMAQYSSQASKSATQNSTLGFLAVLAAAITSGFAGVYFEKLLKGGSTSLWMRNFHLGLSSVPLGFARVLANGFFFGYNRTVLFVIVLQAIGGLVVAVVVKYADNILKGFAAAFSILTSCTMCYFWFDFHPNLIFCMGALLVTVSMYLYSLQPKPKSNEDSSPLDIAATAGGELSNGGSGRYLVANGQESSASRLLVPSSQGIDNV